MSIRQGQQYRQNGQNIDDELEASLRGGVWDKLCGCVRLWFLTRFEEVIGSLYTRRYKVHATAADAKAHLVEAQTRLQDKMGQGQIALAEQKVHLQHFLSPTSSSNGQNALPPRPQKMLVNPLAQANSSAGPSAPAGRASQAPPVMADLSDQQIEKVALSTLLKVGSARDAAAEKRLHDALTELYKTYPTYVAQEIVGRTMQLWENLNH